MDEIIIIDFNLALAETEIKRLEYLIKLSIEKTFSEDDFSCFQESANKTIHLQFELNLWQAFKNKQLKSSIILNPPSEFDIESEILSFLFLKTEDIF